jgi:hypothetical protein
VRVFALALLISLAVAPAAGATEVEVSPQTARADSHLSIAAGPGEVNSITVQDTPGPSPSDDSEWRVTDSGAPLSAGRGCRTVNEHEAVCTAFFASASLGDGDDRFTGGGDEFLSAHGGPGDDALTGGPDDETLRGGEGRDTLDGGGGNDHLAGGADPAEADVVTGGSGTDWLDYSEHPAEVSVNLADPGAPAGAPGEGDRVSGIEDVTGSVRHRSVLIGDDGPNRLGANVPGSRVVGGRGNDSVSTRGGSVDAGPGDDRVFGTGQLRCGSGTDTVSTWALGLVARDCERVELNALDIDDWFVRPHPTIRGARLTFRVPCPREPEHPGDCAGRISLREPGRDPFARRGWTTREGRTRAVGLELGARELARIRRSGGLRVIVRGVVLKGEEVPTDGSWSVVLRAP